MANALETMGKDTILENDNATQKVKKIFWDIESYDNLFICGLLNENNHLDMFYQVNTGDTDAVKSIEKACIDSGYDFTLYDLSQDISRLRQHFEKRVPTKDKNSLLADFLGETDKPVEAREEHYFGYNTLHYDIPMIDHILHSAAANRLQLTPAAIREYSNLLIGPNAPYFNTTPYEMYANQIDCAYLNESMIKKGHPMVGLKTLVGIKGGSIIESESNQSGHSNDIYYDTLYNINDIVELRDVVFPGIMASTFENREVLLNTFPSLRQHQITPNSSSAKFVEFIVAPDGPIYDPKVVDFMYPAKHIAKELNVSQVDMLEATKDWYLKNVYQRVAKNNLAKANDHLAGFMSIYQFYNALRGENWNTSARHLEKYGNPAKNKLDRRDLTNRYATFLPLIDENGNENGTYVNFSLGGIHGAEINQQQLNQDRQKIAELRDKYQYISKIPPKAVTKRLLNLIIKQSRSQVNGYPQHFSHEVPEFYRQSHEIDEILPPEQFTPFMYDKSKQKLKEMLIDRYKYTSIGNTVHQDFDGYYVRLLINSGAFYDGHGKDVYNEIFQYRLKLKDKLKNLTFGTKEYLLADIPQKGYKLVLNTASGILDGGYDTNIRANNKAIAMRSIGQMITFRIAMALSINGANAPSTNTDGVYVAHIDFNQNKKIVDHELKKLYVAITPEPLYLVSKDTNNRMEMKDGKIASASGGDLASFQGARVDKNLNHPAMIDKIMTLYLQNPDVLNGDVDKDLIQRLVEQYYQQPDVLDAFKDYQDGAKRTVVYMASWVLRNTSGSIMIDDNDHVYPKTIRGWLTEDGIQLWKYNVKKQQMSKSLNEFADYLMPSSKLGDPELINHLSQINVMKYFQKAIDVGDYQNQRLQYFDEHGKRKHGVNPPSVPVVKQTKISGLPAHAHLLIDNHSILKMSETDIDYLYRRLDLSAYVDMAAETAKSWQNPMVKS